jgi:subtilisin family serine protease
MKRPILLFAVFTLLAATAQAADDFVADELLVSFQPGTRGAVADRIRAGLGAKTVKVWSEINAEHWELPRGLGVDRAIQALAANPNVLFAEPNYLVHADAVPNDARRAETWALHNLGLGGGMPDADIDAPEAWEVRHDASSVVVAVIDSGIDYDHPDLAGNIWTNFGETGTDSQGRDMSTNGVDDDGNGYVDDIRGWDFINNDNNPFDDNGHGTHVAGTIGAVGNNEIGVAGVAWSVQLMPLKMLDANGFGSLSAVVSALSYAGKFVDASGNQIVRISNNSYSSGTTKSKTVENVIKNFLGLVVASAGNSSTTTIQYPAGYNLANVLAVGATDRNDQLAPYSNYGAWVLVAAPGSDILSTVPGGYGRKSGTSMAAPHVSGVAALLLAQNPGWAVTDLKAQIANTADVLPVLAGKVSSGGRLNARKALGAPEAPSDTTPPAAITDLGGSSATVTSITLSWTAPADNDLSPAYVYQLRYGTSPPTEESFGYMTPIEIVPQNPGVTDTYTVDGLQIGTLYYFAVKAVDKAGNPSPMSNIASAPTEENGWRYMTVSGGQSIGNNAIDAASNLSGGWTIVTENSGNLKYFNYVHPSPGYQVETIGLVTGGASLAYDAAWNIGVSYISDGKLYFAQKISGAWSSIIIENRDILNGDTSCAYDGAGTFWAAYPKGGRSSAGLHVARKTGTSWTIQLVAGNGDGIYNQLAIDPNGRPSVVYADDVTGMVRLTS